MATVIRLPISIPIAPDLSSFLFNKPIFGYGIFDAATGEIIKGLYMPAVSDVGRGISAAFDPNFAGCNSGQP
jgi:hypothetical protein